MAARISFLPYELNQEDALRLYRTLLRRSDGSATVRDLVNRHRVWRQVIEAAAAAGIIRLEKRQPRTGRPSLVAVVSANGVNKCQAAKLPLRCEQPLPLSFREEDFLRYFICKRGCPYFASGEAGAGSAAEAYRAAYGRHKRITPGSSRSAGARLIKQPWIRAAIIIDRQLMGHGGRLKYPRDLRSQAHPWLYLLRAMNGAGRGDWTPAQGQVIRYAKTYPEAISGLRALENSRV